MHIPSTFKPNKSEVLTESELEIPDDLDHLEFAERLRKTLYYGKVPSTDRPSLPMTELAVDFFRDASPKQLGRVDTYWASSVGRRACVSPCSMMLGMMYIERLKHRNPEYLQNTPSSDLFLVSMMVASKYLYDEGVDEEVFNDEWAESAKIDVDEINEMERDFLAAIDWSVFVKAEEFWNALTMMEQRIAWKEGVDRGFFTYTDVMVLSDRINAAALKHALAQLCKLVLVCSVTYTAGALVLVGSVATLSCLKACSPTGLTTPPLTPDALSPETPAIIGSGDFHLVDLPFVQDFSPDTAGSNESLTTDTKNSINEAATETQLGDVTSTVSDGGNNEGIRKVNLRFSGLLTLTLIRDTVVLFLKSVSESHYSGYGSQHNSRTGDDGADLPCNNDICTCGEEVNDWLEDRGMLGCAACRDGERRLVKGRGSRSGVHCGSCWCGLADQRIENFHGFGNVWRSKITNPPFADVTVGFHTAPPPGVVTTG